MRILLTETQAELLDILTTLVLGMDHHTISTCCHISMTTLQGVLDRLSCYQRLTPGDDHKVACDLGLLTGLDLIAEAFDGILGLDSICSKKGILLQADLVLNNDGRNTQTFQGAYRKDEMLQLATCITIVNDRLGGYFQRIIEVMQTSSQVDGLNVGFAFRGRVCQR